MKKIRCEVYSRIVGYFRPINNWNDGKKQEFFERVAFHEKKSMETPVKLVVPTAQPCETC